MRFKLNSRIDELANDVMNYDSSRGLFSIELVNDEDNNGDECEYGDDEYEDNDESEEE